MPITNRKGFIIFKRSFAVKETVNKLKRHLTELETKGQLYKCQRIKAQLYIKN